MNDSRNGKVSRAKQSLEEWGAGGPGKEEEPRETSRG